MTTRRDDIRLDSARAIDLLEQTAEALKQLDGIVACDVRRTNDKEANRRMANLSRQLLHAAHLADCARLEVMNLYFAFKGEEPAVVGMPIDGLDQVNGRPPS